MPDGRAMEGAADAIRKRFDNHAFVIDRGRLMKKLPQNDPNRFFRGKLYQAEVGNSQRGGQAFSAFLLRTLRGGDYGSAGCI